jgi:hypothetical protein
MNNII